MSLYDLNSDNIQPSTPSSQPSQESILWEAANVLNDIIHRRLNKCDIDLTTFNLKACVESTNTLLWDFICACTRSVQEPFRSTK